MSAPNASIAARLAEIAARHPDRAAIIEGAGRKRRVLTFGALADRVARVAARLRGRGLEPGDAALLFVPMSIDLYTALLAVLHAGGTAVFLDAWAGAARLEAAVEAASPRAFIGSPRAHLLRLRSAGLRRIPINVVAGPWPFRLDDSAHGHATSEPTEPAAFRRDDDPALVTFTTGSTGRPRAAARTHGFLWAQHTVLAHHLGLTGEDLDMATLPVFVLNNLATGATTVLPRFDPRRPADIDPGRILRQMRDEGVTTTAGSPAFYERLARHIEGGHDDGPIPVRALFTGGAPVFPPLADRLQRATAGDVEVLYGSTEAEPIAAIPAAELVAAAGEPGAEGVCAGRVVPELRLRLIRPVDGPVVLGPRGWAEWDAPTGEAGEIVVTGPHVLAGYLGDPEGERMAKIPDGDRVWHRTGDGGRLDDRGRLWLLGRVGQRVRREDGTWWSMAAEARAVGVAGVAHAAYLGVPAGDDAQRAVLCVEAAPSPELDGRLRAALAPYPVDEIRVLPAIPRDPRHASKTDLARLRELLG